MINNIKEKEMRDKNEIEDESRSIKKPKSEERNMWEGIIMKRTISSSMKLEENLRAWKNTKSNSNAGNKERESKVEGQEGECKGFLMQMKNKYTINMLFPLTVLI